MSYLAQLPLRSDSDFYGRTVLSIINAAISIVNESSSTSNHEIRKALALKILNRTDDFIIKQMLDGVICSGIITLSSTDAELDTRVSAIWDSYAGI